MPFDSLQHMVLAAAEAVRPPERIDVPTAAERYHIVKTAGQHAGPFSLEKTPYLREPMECLTSLDYTGMVFAGPARTGKALALDTPIATPGGWTTMGELAPGNKVFDEQGTICRVVTVTDVMHGHDCFDVGFSDGAQIIADRDHQWSVEDAHRPGLLRTMTTGEMLSTFRYGKSQRSRYSIPVASPLQMPARILPIDPYVLGAWLGDGSTDKSELTASEFDATEMLINIRQAGVAARLVRVRPGVAAIRLSDRTYGGRGGARAPITCALDRLFGERGFRTKHIPADYLRASIDQRMSLLQGLMDTDGHADVRGLLEFCTTSPEIAEGFAELLSSLGYKYGLSKRPAARKIAYRFHFVARPGDVMFRLERKQKRVAATSANRKNISRRHITSITARPSVPVRCIQVDSPSHLFLAGRQMVPTHNSSMFINWLCHTAITDPSDMMIVHMSRDNAREWSNGDLARAIRNSPELAKRIRPGRNNDNTFDKTFLSGMRLSVTWPTIKNLSGKTIRYVWVMDSDRIKPQLIDNEAHVYDAAKKRTGTFKRYGMTVAEASPGFPVKDAKWIANANEPHEAPPCEGILSLYNRGDRRRWFWECLFCGEWFEPRFKLLRWPNSTDLMEAAEQAHMACPHCFEFNREPLLFSHLPELNNGGRWIKEGQRMVGTELVGTPRRSDIASFWMFGPAAGLASDWKSLVLTYLRACEDFDKTGNDANLMTTITVDQGEAYVPPALLSGLLPETLKARAEDWGGHDAEGVPYLPAAMKDGGFLISAIDVQGGGRPSFVVHTFAVTTGFDIWHVDMRKITKSERRDPESGERYLIDPAAHPEDWDVLISQVIERTYPLPDDSGRRMAVKMTVCDSGGKAGVTRNAYEFYHRLREKGEHMRFHLLAGRPSKTDTATIRMSAQENWSDSKKYAIPLGAIPLWLVNSNIVKDAADAKLRRAEPGGMIHFPAWAQDWLYAQLTTEVRDPDKGWLNPNDKRNEAWDLLCYCIAFCDHPDIRIRYLDWQNPPSWAAGWDRNDYVIEGDARPFQVEFETKPKRSLADIAKALG